MKFKVLVIALLSMSLTTSVFGGGLSRSMIGNIKQFVGSALVMGMFVCGTISCTKEQAVIEHPKPKVATLSYDQDTTIKEAFAVIEQAEDAQIGIIREVDYNQNTVTVETAEGVMSLQLSKGEVLVNNSDSSLEVILSEEAFDEGLIAEGSLIAIIPGVVVAGSGLILAGLGAFLVTTAEEWSLDNVVNVGSITMISIASGLGVYYGLTLL